MARTEIGHRGECTGEFRGTKKLATYDMNRRDLLLLLNQPLALLQFVESQKPGE